MELVVLDRIPFEVTLSEVLEKMHMPPDDPESEGIARLVGEAVAAGRPKAVYRPAPVGEKGEDFVVIEGIRFDSRVLRVNLEAADRVFPYVVTCGRELEEWSRPIHDVFDSYCADMIKEMVLISARKAVMSGIDRQYGLEHAAYMSPGSLADWPVTEQPKLFRLLGDVRGRIGVELSESCLMFPIKSVSGIYFPLEETFESCQLCDRAKCPKRRAPYDKDLFGRSYSRNILRRRGRSEEAQPS